MSWKGKFLPTAPKVEKRPRDDEDTDEDKDDKKKDKRSKNDAILSVLVQNDNTLRKFFNVKKDDENLALQSLYYYRYDALLAFLASRPDFEMLIGFMYKENLNVTAVIERLAVSTLRINGALTDTERNKFTDVEKAYAELAIKSLFKIDAVRDNEKVEKFHAALGNLFLAQFEATPEIKAIIDFDEEEEDDFGDVLLQDRIDQLFELLSKSIRARTGQQPLNLADIVKQRILSFLSDNDFNNYCKTTKGLAEICESGRWKDAISDLRFERQFEKDAVEVLQLRFRFYPTTDRTVNFRNAAIRVAKFFNQLFDSAEKEKKTLTLEEKKQTIEEKVTANYGVGNLSTYSDIPLVLYFLGKLHPTFAEEFFFSMFAIHERAVKTFLIDGNGKTYNDELFVKKLGRLNKVNALLEISDEKTIVTLFEKSPNDEVWSKLMETFFSLKRGEIEYYTNLFTIVVPRWLNTANGKSSRLKGKIIQKFTEDVFSSDFYSTALEDNFDITKTSSELWNRCIFYVLEQYAKIPAYEGRVGPYDTIFLSLQLHKVGKLDADLVEPCVELLTEVYTKELKSPHHSNSVSGLSSRLFEMNKSPTFWLPLVRTIYAYRTADLSSDEYNYYYTEAEFSLSAGWFALQMMKNTSEENKENLAELREIAESALPNAGRLTGEDNDFIAQHLPQLMQQNDDPHVWILTLRKQYDRSVDWIARFVNKKAGQKVTEKQLTKVLEKFYNVARKMQDFGFLTIANRGLMARFVLKNIKYFTQIEGASDWASRVLGYKE